ncbi:hypothetical protein ACFSQJ_07665 [Croceitalea marina]|uniref:Uncharacterized protein n=1 Tax=Croceitalea marina TaxID=1775166 RepID=A0ABW5MUQ9_9FLAO
MQSNQNTNTNQEGNTSKDYLDINGVEHFMKSLEKYFFAEATVKLDTSKTHSKYHLIIGLNCNFGLTESLFHLNSGNWGGFCKNSTNLEFSGFELAVADLQDKNQVEIIVEETAIHFKDTSIFITKIPNQDITDQLCAILSSVSENFVHFTRGLTEMPYEIFIPVFEETSEENSTISWAKAKIRTSYFSYWGMYFHSEVDQDSLVYDLKNKIIIDGDFFLLNKE